MIIALIANFAVIYILIWWVTQTFKSSALRRFLLPAVAFKIFAGLALGLVYIYYYHGGDTWNYFEEARRIIHFSREHPNAVWSLLLGRIPDITSGQNFNFSHEPRAFFFAKVVAFFYLATGGNYWLISVYFSLIGVVGCFYFAERLLLIIPRNQLAIVIALLFFPSFIFWSSGLSKESISVAAICLLAAETLSFMKFGKIPGFGRVVWLVLALIMLWKLKYFYAAVLYPILLSLLMVHWVSKGKWSSWPVYKSVGWFAIIFVVLTLLVSQLHYNLQPKHIVHVVYENYSASVQHSSAGKSIRIKGFEPTVASFVTHFPQAVFGGLFRPNVWDLEKDFRGYVAMENLLVTLLFLISVATLVLKPAKPSLFFWAGLIYVIILSGFLAYSSPNFGTLSRYKVGFEPFFILMILATNPVVSKIRSRIFTDG